MNEGTYLWRNGGLEIIDASLTTKGAGKRQALDLYCVDTYCGESYGRYGIFTEKGWEEIPLESFPPEFRTHLLLMGVT